MRLKTLLITVMGLLSILVFFLALIQQNVLWLWIAFVCSMISGVFLQLLINRKQKNEAASQAHK